MNLLASTTIEINGLSLTLSVRAAAADLRILLDTEEASLEDDALSDLFHESLVEIPTELQKFRGVIFQNLMVGSIKHLMQKLEDDGILVTHPDTAPTQEKAA